MAKGGVTRYSPEERQKFTLIFRMRDREKKSEMIQQLSPDLKSKFKVWSTEMIKKLKEMKALREEKAALEEQQQGVFTQYGSVVAKDLDSTTTSSTQNNTHGVRKRY